MINFLISHNNTNSQSTEQLCDEKKENHQTRGYHLIEHHILKDIFITLVWQTVKRIYFNILEVEGLVPWRQPIALFLPKLFLNWSLPVPIDFVTWYVFTVDHPDITITDWQRVFTRDVWLCPKINMWCMNFIERQGMVRFEVFPIQCMMHEILLKIHWMPEFFFTKKIVGGKSVVSYSPVFFY